MGREITNYKGAEKMSGILKIKLGEEYKAKIEKFEEFENSFFKEVYDKARECTRDIINSKNGEKLHENYNNIISFVGERGTGKTSAMLSFAGALREGKYKDKEESFKGFETVGVIDPSLLHKNSNILEIIIAKMFHEFRNDVEKKDFEINENIKRDLLGNFETVFDSLRIINEKKDVFKEETLDALIKISETTNLKSNIEKLVNNYLKFKNKMGNSKLIIEIDDIDLNTKHAYEMIEQVRKYLVLPNIIILMAVKVEQLGQIIEKSYKQEFDILLNENNVNTSMTYEDIHTMTEKYLEKLIPLERRLYLPKLDNEGLENFVEIEGKKEEITLERKIRTLIYEKTGMMFFNSKLYYSYIIPRNLRELVNLISFFSKLNMNKKIENLNRFKNYFLNDWVANNLSKNNALIINELLEKESGLKGKYIISALYKKYNKIFEDYQEKDKRRVEFRDIEESILISNVLNNPLNISLGDILLYLNLIERFEYNEEDKKLIFAIKTVYSFILYEKIKNIKELNKSIKETENEIETKKYKEKKDKSIYEYKIFLGNNIASGKQYRVFESERNYSEKIKEDIEKLSEISKIRVFDFIKYFISFRNEKSYLAKTRVNSYYRYNSSLLEIEDKREEKIEFEELLNNGLKINFFNLLRNGWSNQEEIEGKEFYAGNIEFLEQIFSRNSYNFELDNSSLVFHINKKINELKKNVELIKVENGFKNSKRNIDNDKTLNNIQELALQLNDDEVKLINSLFQDLKERTDDIQESTMLKRRNDLANNIMIKIDQLKIRTDISNTKKAKEKLIQVKLIVMEQNNIPITLKTTINKFIDNIIENKLKEEFKMDEIIGDIKNNIRDTFKINIENKEE